MTTPQQRLIAVLPSVGIRVRDGKSVGVGPDIALIEIVDGGARGYPSFFALVTVDCKAEGYCILNPAQASRSIFCVANDDDDPPYSLPVPHERWPSSGAGALVLLFFFEKIKGGQAAESKKDSQRSNAEKAALDGTAAPPSPPAPKVVDTENANWPLIVEAIETLLSREPADHLERARVDVSRGRKRAAPVPTTSFALMSCQYPCDILDHMPAGRDELPGPADASLLELGKLLAGVEGEPSPTLLLEPEMSGSFARIAATSCWWRTISS